jgi:tRNA (cmo5U34)-methyltransferase
MNQFDTKAQLWDENPLHYYRSLAIANEIKKSIPLHTRWKAIEFGAGTAILSIMLADQVGEIILMDNSKEMLRMAQEKISSKGLHHLKPLFFNLEESDYIGNKVEFVFTQMALHHVKDVSEMLQKFYHLLIPGAYLSIADLYPEDGSFHGLEIDVHHGFEPDLLKKELESIGFSEISFTKVYTIQKATDNTSANYSVFLLNAKKNG